MLIQSLNATDHFPHSNSWNGFALISYLISCCVLTLRNVFTLASRSWWGALLRCCLWAESCGLATPELERREGSVKKKQWEERNNNKQWEGVLNRERDRTEEKRNWWERKGTEIACVIFYLTPRASLSEGRGGESLKRSWRGVIRIGPNLVLPAFVWLSGFTCRICSLLILGLVAAPPTGVGRINHLASEKTQREKQK